MNFFFFKKKIGKNIGKSISKNLSCKHSPGMLAMRQKLFHHSKESATDTFKSTSKRVINKNSRSHS